MVYAGKFQLRLGLSKAGVIRCFSANLIVNFTGLWKSYAACPACMQEG
jgi:hypothetical protein